MTTTESERSRLVAWDCWSACPGRVVCVGWMTGRDAPQRDGTNGKKLGCSSGGGDAKQSDARRGSAILRRLRRCWAEINVVAIESQ